jgi:putative ATP-dependent endonuclease of OLD family
VAIVPLGGRHVQHFWRLLSDLEIPYATLLDLDVGREGGGFGRAKTAIEKLIAIGAPKTVLLSTSTGMLTDEQFAQMHTWTDIRYLPGWAGLLKAYGVYFSEPLDLDLMMLRAFPEAYAATIPLGGGPRSTMDKAAEAALGAAGAGLAHYVGPYDKGADMLPAYRYHFLTRSKPATHLAALAHITPQDLKTRMPPILAELLMHVANSLRRI